MSTGFTDKNRLTIGTKIHRKRAHKRFKADLSCQIMSGTHTISADVVNISAGGIRLVVSGETEFLIGVSVVVTLNDFKPRFACVRWSSGQTYGLQFLGSAENDARFKGFIDSLEAAKNAERLGETDQSQGGRD